MADVQSMINKMLGKKTNFGFNKKIKYDRRSKNSAATWNGCPNCGATDSFTADENGIKTCTNCGYKDTGLGGMI